MVRYKNFVIFETKEDLQTHCEAIVPSPRFWSEHDPNDVDYKFEDTAIVPPRHFPCSYERCEEGGWCKINFELALKKIKSKQTQKENKSILFCVF